jgi:hypothetical protein
MREGSGAGRAEGAVSEGSTRRTLLQRAAAASASVLVGCAALPAAKAAKAGVAAEAAPAQCRSRFCRYYRPAQGPSEGEGTCSAPA